MLLAGLHKTGTTSVQRALAAHARHLLAAGWSYPTIRSIHHDRFVVQQDNHSWLLRSVFRNASVPFLRSALQGLDKILAPEDRRNLLLVAEGVSTMAVPDLQRMRQRFEAAGFDVEVHCCVRVVGDWLNSAVAQKVYGQTSPRLTLPAAIANIAATGAVVRGRIETLVKAFGEVRFFDFASAVGHEYGPAGYFLERIGIPVPPDLPVLRANEGGSDLMVRLHDAINRHMGPRHASGDADLFYGTLRSWHPQLFASRGPRFSLRHHEVAPLISMLEQENQWLGTTFGATCHQPALVFPGGQFGIDAADEDFLRELGSALPGALREVVDTFVQEYSRSE